jgi:hypothetical protein
MKQEIGREWLVDLRDGTRRQGAGYLRRDGRQCCLDLLNEQAVRKGVIPEPVYDPFTGAEVYENLSEDGYVYAELHTLPTKVAEWAGLEGDDPVVLYRGKNETLSALNDSFRLTFPEIADIIEDQLL